MNKPVFLDDRHSMTIERDGDRMHVNVLGPDLNIRKVACRAFLAAIDATKFAIVLEHREFAPEPVPVPEIPLTVTDPGRINLIPAKSIDLRCTFRADMNKEPGTPPEKP